MAQLQRRLHHTKADAARGLGSDAAEDGEETDGEAAAARLPFMRESCHPLLACIQGRC